MKLTIRNMLAYLYANTLLFSGIASRSLKQFHESDDILSIFFHNPSRKLFEEIVKLLKRQNVTFISTEQLNMICKGKMVAPKSPVVITIDDGWLSNKENVVQVAKEHDIPVTIFVSTEPVYQQKPFWWSFNQTIYEQGIGYMNSRRLKKFPNNERIAYLNGYGFLNAFSQEAMSESDLIELVEYKNIFIESHTVTHPILSQCSDEEAEREIQLSKQQLETSLKTKIKGFAYPNGSYTPREKSLLEKHGYEYAFTTRSAFVKSNDLKNRFELPRIEVLDHVSFAENKCRVAGVWPSKETHHL